MTAWRMRIPEAQTRAMLARTPRDIEDLVKTLPAHHDYMTNLIRYLKQKRA